MTREEVEQILRDESLTKVKKSCINCKFCGVYAESTCSHLDLKYISECPKFVCRESLYPPLTRTWELEFVLNLLCFDENTQPPNYWHS